MDPTLELMMAAVARLRATPAIVAYVGQRIYDRIPASSTGTWNTQFPFISNGPTISTPDDYDCVQGEDITIQFDVWSSGSGEAYDTIQARKIANLVKRALHNAELSLTTNALVSLEHVLTRHVPDPNPALHHFAIQFRATVETPGV
ncbi:DUF3168 domain-containing protein [Devosia elaeis]|uniref:DUF3168 domain-containing protein n=1 Tax=Devosia elaeis TaxID=1770058 RepID=A0A178I0H3_9HYPH|nr:DUF3168 domain-containing protein [Devosia elaeis]OAM77698.1 hypothetical protein A3840_08690 [Devosia elaeis]